MDTRAYFCLVSCHHDICQEALKQKVIPVLIGMENAMFKQGLHKKMVTSSSTSTVFKSLICRTTVKRFKQKLKYMKNAIHIEYQVMSIGCMLAVWKQLEEGGMLWRLLGRDIAILEKSGIGLRELMQCCNMFFKLSIAT